MPNRLNNWTFKNAVGILTANYFTLRNIEGSHHYYVGKVAGKICVVEVQFHANKSIPTKTLQHSIIPKSGIPQDYWIKNCSNIKKCKPYKNSEPFDVEDLPDDSKP